MTFTLNHLGKINETEGKRKRRQRKNRGHKKSGVGLECLLAFANDYNPLLAGRGPLSAINEGAAFAFFTTKITHTYIHTHK